MVEEDGLLFLILVCIYVFFDELFINGGSFFIMSFCVSLVRCLV